MYYPDSIPILCYHSIDGRDSSVFMDPRSFAAQMRYMKRKGFTTLSLEEIINYSRNGTASDEKPIGIVFDDGYKTITLRLFRFPRSTMSGYHFP